MVLYLNGSRGSQNPNYKSMTDTVKSILYWSHIKLIRL